ncbi:hypothetical protein SCYAM73S_00704 [Streptomyces cyaneofuscatus]
MTLTWSTSSTVPSSGSLTVTVNGTESPKENRVPSAGVVRVTVGAVLPAVTTRLAVPVSPSGSAVRVGL